MAHEGNAADTNDTSRFPRAVEHDGCGTFGGPWEAEGVTVVGRGGPRDFAPLRPGRRAGYGAGMVTLEEVAGFALAMPDAVEGERWGTRAWSVGGKVFAWERSFSKADLKRFGDAPVPAGPIVAVRVDDLGEKEAVLGAGWKGVFTIPHFDGYAAVLVQLQVAGKKVVRELVVDAWLACAPAASAAAYVETRGKTRKDGW